jgi:hypothetical protein
LNIPDLCFVNISSEGETLKKTCSSLQSIITSNPLLVRSVRKENSLVFGWCYKNKTSLFVWKSDFSLFSFSYSVTEKSDVIISWTHHRLIHFCHRQTRIQSEVEIKTRSASLKTLAHF